MDRRTSIKWVLTASVSVPFLRELAFGAEPAASATTAQSTAAIVGYGSDPNLLKIYKPGELWPLTFTSMQRRSATVLSDLIIPADDTSPSASAVGVVDFIDEWISAPYIVQQRDHKIVLEGLAWLEHESERRFSKLFASLEPAQLRNLCDDICCAAKAKPEFVEGAKFFARYRDLTAGGFYTTPEGRKDLNYVGNLPLASFEGPPLDVLKKAGLA